MSAMLDLDLAEELRGAHERGEMVLHFQPEIDLASGGVVGMEALMRWAHPRRGLLPPNAFLEVAHKAGLLLPLSTWVLEECAAERARWELLPPHPTVGLCQLWANVPAVQLSAAGFVDSVRKLFERHQLPARSLGLEFSESTLGDVGSAAASLLLELREVGCALAVDDFGTWYSSLARFDDMPVDAVKLDRRFVRGLGVDLDEDSIVASVVRLAHARDLYVVAEGVESWTEGARLCELGCDRAHGFLFCGPQEASRARSMLARGGGWTPASPEALARATPLAHSPARPEAK
ncbi:MAG TPA: EAL domain-containing protein [Frankiaceae bacterium]|jgi:EAL domain-containing protein (putative c-di-GMP-specific phosphodiesterase class I)|nr:EAL domain-containing protein [Frankiaceae bacterium]